MRLVTRLVFSSMVCALFVLSAGAAEHTKDSLDTVKKRLKNEKAVLIDVRELSEWDAGHLKDAKLVPLRNSPETKPVFPGFEYYCIVPSDLEL